LRDPPEPPEPPEPAELERIASATARAAAALIAGEAGARIALPSAENGDLVIAAAPDVFDELRAVVQPAASETLRERFGLDKL
jgi:hypothetical protein